MEFTLNKSQRLVVHAATKDDLERTYQACVHIRKGIIEATNGYILIQKQIDYDGDEDILLKAADIAKFNDKTKSDGVVFTKAPESSEVRAVGRETTMIETQPGKFPDMEQFFPKTISSEVIQRLGGTGPFKIALNRRQLLDVLRSMDDTENIIKFYFYGEKDGVKFEAGSTKGLIMPMDVHWECRLTLGA